mmetsp:Transcript_34211/g.74582  ORF Transcript_34211/g.74582 Transcript_34211/m.74582 type:complete len:88 (+) Transcript_34211:291-554(+)
MVEQCANMCETAEQKSAEFKDHCSVDVVVSNVQSFDLFKHPTKYSCVWCQWIVSHLLDSDAVYFLSDLKCIMNEESILVVKDNFYNS